MTKVERARLIETYVAQIQTDIQREMVAALGESLANKTAILIDAVEEGLDEDAVSRVVHVAVAYSITGMLQSACNVFPCPKEQVVDLAHASVDCFAEEFKEGDGQSFFDHLASLNRGS